MNPRTRVIPIALAVLSTLATISCSKGPAGKIMIGADCTVSSAPHENLQAAVSTAHGVR